MRVLLIDADRTRHDRKMIKKGLKNGFPNIALMKISAYHKGKGDEVGFDVSDPEKVYISCVFTWNRDNALSAATLYPTAEIDIGGSGVDLKKRLPVTIGCQRPDYSLYGITDTSYGSTTKGCIRNCYFCIVREKEGPFQISQHPSAFIGKNHKNIVFMDNNILANKEWFLKVCDYVKRQNLKCDFNQGLDARLLDADIAKALSELKPMNHWKIAFDDRSYEEYVKKAIDLMRESGINVRRNLLVYVYCHNDAHYDDAVYRCRKIKEWGATAFSMINKEAEHTPRLGNLKHWTRVQAFHSFDIDDYDRSVRYKKIDRSHDIVKELCEGDAS